MTFTTPDTDPIYDAPKAALDFRPTMRGVEWSLQQFRGTSLVQWWFRKAVYWEPCGPVMHIKAERRP